MLLLPTLPAELRQAILRIFGEAGARWCARFPETLAACVARWQLTLGAPFAGLSINYVTRATLPDGTPVVLKLGVPHREMRTEIEALRRYDGRHSVRCLDADPAPGALLLESLAPGHKLSTLGDDAQATAIAGALMRTLPRPAPAQHGLPTFAEWLDRAFRRYRTTYGAAGPLGDLPDAAERAFRQLDAAKPCAVLLHGDLHHDNILYDDRRGWLAIDPKGVIGAPALEAGRYLHNYLPSAPAAIACCYDSRIAQLSDLLQVPQADLYAVALVDKVLSLCWCLEDAYVEDGFTEQVAVARMLRER